MAQTLRFLLVLQYCCRANFATLKLYNVIKLFPSPANDNNLRRKVATTFNNLIKKVATTINKLRRKVVTTITLCK